MVYEGVRRCELCASEILGHRGRNICLLCRLIAAGDPDIVCEDGAVQAHVAPKLSLLEGRTRLQGELAGR